LPVNLSGDIEGIEGDIAGEMIIEKNFKHKL
jgi:hypothetical protein